MSLRLEPCSYQAAKYAVKNWHYSKTLPVPKLFKLGVWENGEFKGCVIFSRGASTNLLRPYGLRVIDGCELTRIALREHTAPVSRIVAIALRILKRQNPGLKLVVSYADTTENHIGGIYQAGNWIYTGTTQPDRAWINDRTGKKHHSRLVAENGSGFRKQFGILRRCIDSRGLRKIITPGKHRYLMPLDSEIRKRILPLSKPYPKRAGSDTSDTLANHAGKGGSLPTPALPS